jgi:hypothetical protein
MWEEKDMDIPKPWNFLCANGDPLTIVQLQSQVNNLVLPGYCVAKYMYFLITFFSLL